MSATKNLDRLDRIKAIVIGTSAGGVEALSIVLAALPAGTPVSVFVVIHLPREARSVLVDIYGPKCRLPITEAQDKEPIRQGAVYFAPPDYHLLVDDGVLSLSVDPPVHWSRPSIDVLFESAADVYGDRLLGVLLTGANEDGAAGLAAVQRAGGLTVVQQPASAVASHMPEAALKLVTPDWLLTLPEVGDLLATLP